MNDWIQSQGKEVSAYRVSIKCIIIARLAKKQSKMRDYRPTAECSSLW